MLNTTKDAMNYVAELFKGNVSQNATSDDNAGTFEMTVFYPNDNMTYTGVLKRFRHASIKDAVFAYEASGPVAGVRIRVHLKDYDHELASSRLAEMKERSLKTFPAPKLLDPHTGKSVLSDNERTWVEMTSAQLSRTLPTDHDAMRAEKTRDDVRGTDRILLRCPLAGEVSIRELRAAFETISTPHELAISADGDGAIEVTVSAVINRKRALQA